jgi:hypothetical protein
MGRNICIHTCWGPSGLRERAKWDSGWVDFFFLHFTFFSKNIWSGIFFQNYISSAMGAEAGTYVVPHGV